jgi:hypothetical protein
MTVETISGEAPTALGNAISDAIHQAVTGGMALDEAVSVVVAVAADYARMEYGPQYLPGLAGIVLSSATKPSPQASDG